MAPPGIRTGSALARGFALFRVRQLSPDYRLTLYNAQLLLFPVISQSEHPEFTIVLVLFVPGRL
ncbi:MAG: hypothetical protein CTY22_07780 [Methylomonas sp.]|nr:MAG: hypothetical protein CTY23_08970 [Methylomonas sp.]PPD25682.1 MAG: hypothetical protein CTY22_07780 [Methylomonas sp.]PPD36659.1 MAG: hypothetical protein CTY21_07780 [Methylomonas sp.]PPD40548.1 MAG: hypothetical protein CTY17_06085 [Methylomonas sp.]PPD55223.1 MAG: hypothetical protein CTY11_01915 [Methylomonas sp.]